MTQATVRQALPADAAALAALGAATFTETFGHLYPPADLQTYLDSSHSLDAWVRTLSDSQCAVLVATVADGSLIGFISLGPCKLPVANREPAAGEVRQLYVLSPYQNLQLGSRLMDAGLEWLQAQGFAPLYVGVWSENPGAQRFYQRYGFHQVGEYGFAVGNTIDREFILQLHVG